MTTNQESAPARKWVWLSAIFGFAFGFVVCAIMAYTLGIVYAKRQIAKTNGEGIALEPARTIREYGGHWRRYELAQFGLSFDVPNQIAPGTPNAWQSLDDGTFTARFDGVGADAGISFEIVQRPNNNRVDASVAETEIRNQYAQIQTENFTVSPILIEASKPTDLCFKASFSMDTYRCENFYFIRTFGDFELWICEATFVEDDKDVIPALNRIINSLLYDGRKLRLSD